MDSYDVEIIRLLVRDKGGVMERRSWKSICKALAVVQKPSHNKASAPGCKRCGGRVTHGGYCAACHESYYP